MPHIHMHGDIRISAFLMGRTGRRFLCAEGAQAVELSDVCMKPYMSTETCMVLVVLCRARKFRKRPCTSKAQLYCKKCRKANCYLHSKRFFSLCNRLKCKKSRFHENCKKRGADMFYFLRLPCRSPARSESSKRDVWFFGSSVQWGHCLNRGLY